MIAESTIQAIRDLNIADVVGRYVKLNKHAACCPFHDEKTPSFHIKPAKGIFKCFGCGVGGDGIRFVELHDKLNFYEAIERLARDHGIAIEYDDSYTPEQRQQHQDKIAEYRKVLQYAHEHYMKSLMRNPEAIAFLEQRGVSRETIDTYQLGYAAGEWQGVTPGIIERGWYEPALHLGIVATTEGRNYDVYRNRIIIPITDKQGQLIGFAGRSMGDEKPKYINPRESDMYHKSGIWYGWDAAIKSIVSEQNVYIAEGYFDVISMQRRGVRNTIAACGTSIDARQWKMLKGYTHTVSLMLDGDAAGRDKLMKLTHAALAQGFNVNIVELVEGMDPDDYARAMHPEELTD